MIIRVVLLAIVFYMPAGFGKGLTIGSINHTLIVSKR